MRDNKNDPIAEARLSLKLNTTLYLEFLSHSLSFSLSLSRRVFPFVAGTVDR